MRQKISTAIGVASSLSKRCGICWVQFHKCQAWISDELDERFRLIKSYHTIVGLVDCKERVVYEIGKYSRTTSKQFTQICNQMFSSYDRKYVEGRV